MSLAKLQIYSLRNIQSAQIEPHPKLNIITGINGSGKTSLLEAIYLLGTGHSFRTREISPLVRLGDENLTVFARTADQQTVSIQKSLSAQTQVRLNGDPCYSSSELAHFLPCQVFYQDIFQIIDAGPAVRRSLLDWGLFHVKQQYHALWKDYRRTLKQRNALLRQKAPPALFTPWNKLLAELAVSLHHLRQDYFNELTIRFQLILEQLTGIECTLNYYKGWDKKETNVTLDNLLANSYQSDMTRQFTQVGAHQADIQFEIVDQKAKQFLSRGQQKILLLALKLAQASFIDKTCLFLCDDLTSELDSTHLSKLMNLIKKTKGQFFITTIDKAPLSFDLSDDEYNLFNLTQGQLNRVC